MKYEEKRVLARFRQAFDAARAGESFPLLPLEPREESTGGRTMICQDHAMMQDSGGCAYCRIAELNVQVAELESKLTATEARLAMELAMVQTMEGVITRLNVALAAALEGEQ